MGFKFFERKPQAKHLCDCHLAGYTPALTLHDLMTGVDNLRHDVFLSPRLTSLLRGHVLHLLAKYGEVDDMMREPAGAGFMVSPQPHRTRRGEKGDDDAPLTPAARAAEFKKSLAELQVAALNRARNDGNLDIDVLARLAILRLMRDELSRQFTQVMERCKETLTQMERQQGYQTSARQGECRERYLRFRVNKKTILRKASQELLATLREVEKETVARMRRSLFGEESHADYELFLNRLTFTGDGRDEEVNAEQYILFGNYERDPDRFEAVRQTVLEFLRSLELPAPEGGEEWPEAALNVAENAYKLVGGGDQPDGAEKTQKAVLAAWCQALEEAGIYGLAVASYEAASLLSEYAPLIGGQQLKNALLSSKDLKQVEQLLENHGRLTPDKLWQAAKRMDAQKPAERQRVAARYLFDFFCYHRDLSRLTTLNAALELVNLLPEGRLRELSSINNTLYEFLLPSEQKPAEEKVAHHVILKADVRDSTRLTRTLSERGLNPASYFSLNFYDPVNKLLPLYGAVKVFIEGDAVILALFERENENAFCVSRTCMLAREILGIVRGYNEKSRQGGLPALELGIGICYEDSAPLYLMDGSNRIMISRALNLSDRLSSCQKGARKFITRHNPPFNVFCFQTVSDEETAGNPDEFMMRYNVGGIHIDPAAFERLRSEISLQEFVVRLPMPWGPQPVRFYSGLVPLAQGSYHPIVVREGLIPQINAADFSVKRWTTRAYYEVCVNPDVYQMIEMVKATVAGGQPQESH
jgi:hypothetical protein